MIHDLSNIHELKSLLHDFGIYSKHALGQNFLISPEALDAIIEEAGITPEHHITEIGPGPGALTQRLVETPAKQITLLELDEQFLPLLQMHTNEREGVELIIGDALKHQLSPGKNIVIANIPYYITSPLIRHYTQQEHTPESIILLIQHEVAVKLSDTVDNMSMIALELSLFADCEYLYTVPKDCFFPAPKVDSAIIKITPKESPLVDPEIQKILLGIASMAFAQKRKKLSNSLGKQKYKSVSLQDACEHVGISLDTRPQNIDTQTFIALAQYVQEHI